MKTDPNHLSPEALEPLLKAAALSAKKDLGTITEAERDELQSLLLQHPGYAKWLEKYSGNTNLQDLLVEYGAAQNLAQAALKAFHHERTTQSVVNDDSRTSRIVLLRSRWAAAAAIILLLSGLIYLWQQPQKHNIPGIVQQPVPDIEPGREGAVLTLADGTKLVLDSLGNGLVANQAGAQASLNAGRLEYQPSPGGAASLSYNTISTPRGRQFQVQLPDGTKVWLNAGSSLRYPTTFTGGERLVELEGEAYFEVAHDIRKRFKIQLQQQAQVEVLGTHFNVNAYTDEKLVHTTLLEGSLRVKTAAGSSPGQAILKPGQQARMQATAGTRAGIEVEAADLDKVMAWKNGLFNFEGMAIAEVMRQLERWYDIEVAYEDGIPAIELSGEMTRGVSLNGLLLGLEQLGLHCRLEQGRKLIVLPGK